MNQSDDEKWSGFLSRTVHELRTPLSSILMLSEMTGDQRIHQATTDVLALLAEVSEYGKIEGGRFQVVVGQVVPADLIRKIERDFRPLAEEQEIEIEIKLHPDLPSPLRGDRQGIERILDGLLDHTLRATGLKRVEVELQVEANEMFVVVVRDDGPVVPEEQRATFFVPLLHARAGSRRSHGGQGLGLAIAEALARRLGGELTLQCEVSRGNVLTLRLPLD